MPLGEVLSDIKDNVENIDTKDISTENIEITSIKQNGNNVNIERFSKETLEKVNNMFNLLVLQNNINKLPRVDYALAQEVFTMLPDVSKTETAKLTSNPSMINKEIIEKVFNTNIEDKLSLDISDKLYDLRDLIETNLDKFEEIYKYITSFKEIIENKIDILNNNPPIIISDKVIKSETEPNKYQNYNLYTDKISEIYYLDDTKFEYEKYSKVLIKMYKKLYHDETLKELSSIEAYLDISEVSLKTFVTGINAIGESLQRKENELKQYLNGLNSLDSNRENVNLNTETIEFINGYDSLAYNLEYLNKVYEVIKIENNCLTKVSEIILFLD